MYNAIITILVKTVRYDHYHKSFLQFTFRFLLRFMNIKFFDTNIWLKLM